MSDGAEPNRPRGRAAFARGGPGRRWLVGSGLVVVAGLVLWGLGGGAEGPLARGGRAPVADGVARDGAPAEAALADPGEVAAPRSDVDDAEGDVAGRAALAPEDRGSSERAAAAALCWGDLVAPVDARDGTPLAGARVAHARGVSADAAADGADDGSEAAVDAPFDPSPEDERADAVDWCGLDAVLAAADHARPGFLVVDVPGFVPGLVEVALALAAGERVDVPLAPAAALRIDVVADGAGTSTADIEHIYVLTEDYRHRDLSPIHRGSLGNFEIDTVGDHDPRTGRVVADAEAYLGLARAWARGYEVEFESVARAEESPSDGFFGDEALRRRSPVVRPLVAHAAPDGVGASTLFEGLPAGTELLLRLRAAPHWRFDPADDDNPFGASPPPLVLEPGEQRVLTVHLLGSGGLRGALPVGARNGVVVLAWHGEDGSRVAAESLRDLAAGEFARDALRPGAWHASITWRDADGAHVRIERDFELAAREVHDLGLLAPNAGPDVTVVPRVEIDGVRDPSLLGGELVETAWRFDHSGASLGGELESASADRLAPLVLRGVLGDSFAISFDRPVLPASAARRLRFVEWRYEPRHALSGDLVVEAVLCLASSPRVEFEVVVPPQPGFASQRAVALAQRVGSDEVRALAVPGGLFARDVEQRFVCSGNLDPGTWDVTVAIGTQTPFEEDDAAQSWYGTSRVVVGVGGTFAVEGTDADVERAATGAPRLVLAPAATVVFGPDFDWRGREPNDWFQVVPVGAPDALAPLAYPWPGDGTSHDGAVDGLAPDTEYRVLGSDVRFRSGAAGSRTVLD